MQGYNSGETHSKGNLKTATVSADLPSLEDLALGSCKRTQGSFLKKEASPTARGGAEGQPEPAGAEHDVYKHVI